MYTRTSGASFIRTLLALSFALGGFFVAAPAFADVVTLDPATGSASYMQGDALTSSQVTLSSDTDESGLSTQLTLTDANGPVNFDSVFSDFSLTTDGDGPYNLVALEPGQSTLAYGPQGGYSVTANTPQVTTLTGAIKSTAPIGTYTITTSVIQGGTTLASSVYTVTVSAPVINTTKSIGYTSLQSAVNAATAGDNLELEADLTTTAEVTITQKLTIDGQNHTLSPNFTKTTSDNNAALGLEGDDITIANLTIDGTNGTSLHGINAFKANDAALINVTVKNSDNAALIVNGSLVTASGFNTNGNNRSGGFWGSVNVDPGSGVTAPSSFALVSGTLGDALQIWSDGGHVTGPATVFVSAPGYTQYHLAGTPAFFVWANTAPKGATIAGDANNTLYSTLQQAIDAASTTVVDTILLGSDLTLSSEATVSKSLVIDGQGHTLFAPINNITNDSSNNAGLGIIEAAGNVTVKNLTVDGTGSTKIHGINIFDAANVTLDNVTSKNNTKSGITVNGSTVTVNNITTSGNTWGGINVDLEADATGPTVLTISGTSSHTETGFDLWRDDNSKDVTVNDVNNQYASTTYTSAPGVTGTIWGLNSTTVSSDAALRAALADTLVSTITLSSDITLGSELDITRAVTIDGAGHKLTASFGGASVIQITADNVTLKNLTEDGTGTTGNRGINIFKAANVTLDSVTVSNNTKNGIVVNGSTVTVNNIVTSGNGWEAIDVDLGSGVTTQATLTVNGTSVHGESKAAIRIDDTSKTPTPTVIDTNSQYIASTTSTLTDYFLSTKNIKITTDNQQTVAGVSVAIPAGTIIKGDATWDGIISAPTATTTTVNLSGFNTTVAAAIAVGSSDSDLTFDKAVKLTFAGQAGKRVGWYDHAGTFTEITTTCSADSQAAGDALAAGTSCKIDSGSDLVVWTKHFSTFVAYTAVTASISNGSGGSGGSAGGSGSSSGSGTASSGPIASTASSTVTSSTQATSSTTVETGGEVLGAEAFQFAHNLTIGSTVADVLELQKVLTAEGFLDAKYDTGYFGGLTKAAVVKYQKAHRISPTSGYVGPLTRAELNKGSQQTTPTTTGSTTQTLTDVQISSILNLLSSFGADQATIQNVAHALGK